MTSTNTKTSSAKARHKFLYRSNATKFKNVMKITEKLIFAADANENERLLLNQAFEETKLPFKIEFTKNGEELLKGLENYYAENQAFPKMILLDLNIPKPFSGLEILKSIKAHFLYKTIPILILSSERSDANIIEAYSLGANSFIVKPASFKEFQNFVKTLNNYWFEMAALPTT